MGDEPTSDQPVPDEPAEGQAAPSLTARLDEGRQTFQPGLWLRLTVLGIVGVYLLLFVVLNTKHVHVKFVFTSTSVSLIWVILLSLAGGVVLGVLISQLHRFRGRKSRRVAARKQ
jgi:uncharacterized integral membrane protein